MIPEKADYGLDAPTVVRNLFLFSFLFFIGALLTFRIQDSLWFWSIFLSMSLPSFTLFITGCWMIYGIKIAKPKITSKLIQNLRLKGNEKVLDLGCGRGLLLCEAAKYLTSGEIHGIDIWSGKDQSGNTLEATLENARREGVQEKVTVHTADATALPFPDSTFDAVVSSLCLHNIRDRKSRQQALYEAFRVLKPGGKIAIIDIQYAKEYAKCLNAQGARVACSGPNFSYCPSLTTIEGRKPDV